MSPFLKFTLFNLAASIVVFFGLYIFHEDKRLFNFKNQALYQGFVFLVAEFFALFIKSEDIQVTLIVAFVAAAAIAVEKYAKKKNIATGAEPLMALKSGTIATKKPDDELPWVVGVCGIFTLVYLIVAAALAQWTKMSGWMLAALITKSIFLAFSWRVMIAHWKDPKMDYWRWITILLSLLGIILVLANRADILEQAQVLLDAEQNKVSS